MFSGLSYLVLGAFYLIAVVVVYLLLVCIPGSEHLSSTSASSAISRGFTASKKASFIASSRPSSLHIVVDGATISASRPDTLLAFAPSQQQSAADQGESAGETGERGKR